MKTILYPAVFHKEDVGYSVYLPDIAGCISEGDTMEEAYENIFDALGLCLEYQKDHNLPMPKATDPADIETEKDEFVAIIQFDALKYNQKHNTKAVKKTLSIPAWLNDLAEENNINFSGVLQSALREKLNCN